jgi:hypothetical protein
MANNTDNNRRLNDTAKLVISSGTDTLADDLETRASRRQAIDRYIDEVWEKKRKRITRTNIWKEGRYATRTEFERWERCDPRATKTADERFRRILREKPHLK